MPDWKHPNDMDRDELREMVSVLSAMALDLGQHLNFTNDMLVEEYRDDAYKRAERMAYEISHFPYHGPDPESQQMGERARLLLAEGYATDADRVLDEMVERRQSWMEEAA